MQIQPYGTTFSYFSREVHARRGHENCCRFATLQGVHERVRSRVEHFRIDPTAEVTAELRNAQPEKNGGRGASSRGFVRIIGFFFLCGRCNTGEADQHGVQRTLVPQPTTLRLSRSLLSAVRLYSLLVPGMFEE